MRWLFFLSLIVAWGPARSPAAEVMPPAPAAYFNDYAGLVSAATAQALNAELTQFERDTSNQILVVIYPHMQSDSSIADYTERVKDRWGVGQKGRDNGAVLFVFAQDRKVYLQTNYGLEGALPDALCKRIIDDEITPRFRQGDYDGGLRAGVTAILAATRGEYRGTGRTHAESDSAPSIPWVPVIFILLLVLSSIFRSRQQVVYGSRGRRTLWGGGPWIFPGGGFGGGGGGGFGGGGGGGFSGGGGMGGGGGAGGSW